ncbi:MAG: YggT family protein [Acidimicrobiaceae bacterium]|jgi:YggT family protein
MHIICLALQVYVIVVLARILLSWFPITPGTAMESIDTFLRMLTEPILGPLRRALPPVRLGGMGLDLSPMILLLGIEIIVAPIICSL